MGPLVGQSRGGGGLKCTLTKRGQNQKDKTVFKITSVVEQLGCVPVSDCEKKANKYHYWLVIFRLNMPTVWLLNTLSTHSLLLQLLQQLLQPVANLLHPSQTVDLAPAQPPTTPFTPSS